MTRRISTLVRVWSRRSVLVGGLSVLAATVAGALAGCGLGQPDPSPEAVQTAARLRDVLAAIPGVTTATAEARTHPRNDDREIAALLEVEPDLPPAELLALGTAVRSALIDHQVSGYDTEAAARTELDGHRVTWDLDTVEPESTLASAVDAVGSELGLGARSVAVGRWLNSYWDELDSDALLAECPEGMRRALRWVSGYRESSVSVAIHVDQPAVAVDLDRLVPTLAAPMTSINLVVMDGWARWNLQPRVEAADDATLVGSMTTLLRTLRSAVPRSQVKLMGPWWVTLQCVDGVVTTTEWHRNADRATAGPVVSAVVAEVNR